MSQYALAAQLLDFVGDKALADLSAESGPTYSAAVCGELLTKASAFIDGYIGGRYALPITDATALEILELHCLQIARWYVYERRAAGQYDKQAYDGFKASEDWLKRVQQGSGALPGGTPASPPTTPAVSYGSSQTQVYGTFNDYGGGNPL
jgi:phage gp36-like protein